MYILIQITLLFLFAIFLTSLFKKRRSLVLSSILLGIFFSLQIASVLLGGNFIDYKFFVHFNSDIFLVKDFFVSQSISLFIILISSTTLIYYFGRKASCSIKVNLKFKLFAIVFCFAIMSFEGGAFGNIYHVVKLNLTSDKSFDKSLVDLGIKPSQYILPEDIKATPGKNIIVISLESLERGYLSDQLDHLTPNLKQMSQKMTFFEMAQAPGSEWTAGSIYTEITGLPCYFKNSGNEIFQSSSDIKITGIGHILKKAGYDLTYLLAGQEFAGLGDMLRALQFSVPSDKDFSKKYKLTGWGIRDKDLFNEAKNRVLSAKKTGDPFALFMSTISTHFPDGVYDKRMEGLIPKQKSNLEFMVASVDYLIGELFDFLEAENLLSNTSVFIFPDHRLMGKSSRVIKDFPKPRGLYLITNEKESKFSFSTKKPIYQIDIPKIILEGAGVKHNGKFLTDFLEDENRVKFIRKNKANILALNEASLSSWNFSNGIKIELMDDKILVRSDNYSVNLKVKKNGLYEFTFDKNMRLLSKKALKNFKSFGESHEKTKLFVNIKQERLFAYLKDQNIGIAKQGGDEIFFTKEDITIFSNWAIETEASYPSKSRKYISPYKINSIFLTSSAFGSSTPTEIRIGTKKLPFSRGINLLTKKEGTYRVENFDTYGDSIATNNFIKKLYELTECQEFFALIIHDSGEKQLKDHKKELLELGFDLLTTLNFREAYIGYSYSGIISEYKDEHTLSFKFPLKMPKSLRSNSQINEDANDTSKFIAHAGGEIEGYRYTNSLEALNLSYAKGFRLFELDIIKSSDGKYVAAHDWKTWASQTNYQGNLPPTTAEFINHKIHGKFTPLTMQTINNWFLGHRDAILVTDKVNEPKAFARQFQYKDRLIMELFSLEAVKEGLSIGIKPMPSNNVINKLKGNKVLSLKKLNIRYVAVSRKMIRNNKPFFLKLKSNNIKTYAYNINFEKGKDEAYAVLNDMDYVYGIYADRWNFK